tara:strand:- start:952 stop:1254 length:303 start_codon:yes stop_codon:yes gene_type:complete
MNKVDYGSFSENIFSDQSNNIANDSLDYQNQENGVISFKCDLPAPLQKAMYKFIEKHPNWDQYRLLQAALAGFLVQNGAQSREITRLYVGNMFSINLESN